MTERSEQESYHKPCFICKSFVNDSLITTYLRDKDPLYLHLFVYRTRINSLVHLRRVSGTTKRVPILSRCVSSVLSVRVCLAEGCERGGATLQLPSPLLYPIYRVIIKRTNLFVSSLNCVFYFVILSNTFELKD